MCSSCTDTGNSASCVLICKCPGLHGRTRKCRRDVGNLICDSCPRFRAGQSAVLTTEQQESADNLVVAILQ